MKKHGRLPDDDSTYDALSDQEPVLAHCYSQSTQGTGALRVMDESKARTSQPASKKGIVAQVGGINVHADTVIDGRDRKRLERLVRYMARPPIAQDRLERMPNGHVRYTMKKTWKDGTTSVVLKPHDFIKRLCAQPQWVPPPYFHMTRFYGVLASHAAMREHIVTKLDRVPPVQLPLFDIDDTKGKKVSARKTWSLLLARVFLIDVTVCPKCSGPMKITEAVLLEKPGRHRPRDGPVSSPQLSLL